MSSFRTMVCLALVFIVTGIAQSAEPDDDTLISGMSIVGDHESPKSLVIVPWKSSDLGDRLNVSRLLDDGYRPVDREVFVRELDYYQIGMESVELHDTDIE
jgi:hypothetical protein